MDAGSKRKSDGTTAERLKRLKRLKEEGLLLQGSTLAFHLL